MVYLAVAIPDDESKIKPSMIYNVDIIRVYIRNVLVIIFRVVHFSSLRLMKLHEIEHMY